MSSSPAVTKNTLTKSLNSLTEQQLEQISDELLNDLDSTQLDALLSKVKALKPTDTITIQMITDKKAIKNGASPKSKSPAASASVAPIVKLDSKNGAAGNNNPPSNAASSGKTVRVVSKGKGPSTSLSGIGPNNQVYVVPATGGRRKRTRRTKKAKRTKRTRRHRTRHR